MNKWISIEEETPDMSKDIILYDKMFKEYIVIKSGKMDIYSHRDYGLYFACKNDINKRIYADYWMPLSEPPKTKQD